MLISVDTTQPSVAPPTHRLESGLTKGNSFWIDMLDDENQITKCVCVHPYLQLVLSS